MARPNVTNTSRSDRDGMVAGVAILAFGRIEDDELSSDKMGMNPELEMWYEQLTEGRES